MPIDLSHTSKESFSSEYLACGLQLKLVAPTKRIKTVFICLDDSLEKVLATTKLEPTTALVKLEFPNTPTLHLSLEFLESYAAFLALEIVPFLHDRWASTDIKLVLVAQQFRAVLAVHAATQFAGCFDGVLAASGAFWWKPETETVWEWLTAWLARQRGCPGQVYLLCSKKESTDRPRGVPTTLLANQHLRDVLLAKGCEARLLESASIPSSSAFGKMLTDALEWFQHRDNSSASR